MDDFSSYLNSDTLVNALVVLGLAVTIFDAVIYQGTYTSMFSKEYWRVLRKGFFLYFLAFLVFLYSYIFG